MQLRPIGMVLQFVACMAFAATAFPVTASSAPRSLDGFWESEGFGYVFTISGRSLRAFEVTTSTCVASFTAQRLRNWQPGRVATFRSDEDVYFVRQGGTDDRRVLHKEETIADIPIHRVRRLPVPCERSTPDTPPGNFEVFAQTWAENYISFERRGVDWSTVVAEHRQRIKPETTPDELFAILRAMIEPFGDMHTYLSAPALRKSTERYWRPGTDQVLDGTIEEFANHGRWKLFSLIDQTNLHREAKRVCNRGLHYGDLGGGIGYLRIRSFGDYSRSDDAKALEGCLDTIFGRKMVSLVIDTRHAFGGSDELGLAIAGRLTAEPYLAYAVQARSRSIEGWTAKQPVMVQPSPRPGFRGPIAVLTGPVTLSAAESFVLALMGRRPPVARIGENTQGVFCDVLSRRLPNGWTFGLPNAVYVTSDGMTFDVTGIPPDIPVPVFANAI